MPTTWSTTDKTAGCTLSGGNLVASFLSANQGVRSIDRVYTGKYYWEITFTTTINLGVGIALGTSSLSLQTGPCFFASGGLLFLNGSSLGINLGGTIANGWVCCFALDADNDLIWCRNGAAGTWNGNAANNPATGVGGSSIASFAAGSMGIYAWVNGGGGSGVATANFGASAFTGAVPSGFTSGFPGGTTLVNAAIATQVAAEEWAMPLASAQLTQLAIEEWASLATAAAVAPRNTAVTINAG